MPRLILTFELTVDGEGEDSGGNEVHEIYVRLGAAPATALNEKDTIPCQNEIKDTTPCKKSASIREGD